MSPEEKVKFGGGVIGFLARDPGAKDRFLWSVRFPAHACYRVGAKDGGPDEWHCELGGRFNGAAPQSFRSGAAIGEKAARKAIDEAHLAGRPTSGAKQFVMFHRS